MRYEELAVGELSEFRDALSRGDTEAAAKLIVGLALHIPDLKNGIEACTEGARAENEVVRGNAILGFGHLARRFRQLDRARIEPLIFAGLMDKSDYVRGQAQAAVDDIEFFLGWKLNA